MSAPPSPEPTPTVLVVDDQPEVLEALRRSLRRLGFDVIGTSSPTEALELLARRPVWVLLSDIDMPEMSGVELCTRARALAPQTVRMLLSGRGSLASAIRAINEAEAFRYLTKPWTLPELRGALAEAVGRRRALAALRDAAERTARRGEIVAALEREHPGLTAVELRGGVYAIDGARVRRARAWLGGRGPAR